MKRKGAIPAAAFLAVAVTTFSLAHGADTPRIFVNGKRLDADIIMKDDRIYVPLRAVNESLGAEVSWDGDARVAYVDFTEEDQTAMLVEEVSPCVVAIIGNYKSDDAAIQYNNPTVHGSGVVYKSNGYILTNAHVVKDIKNLTVILNDGTSLPGSVLYSDEKADLAVVKVNKIGLKAIKMADHTTIASGKTALAIGTPISMSLRNSVTKGIISSPSVDVSGSYYKLIQTDTTINPGNSGGPLINSKGELIGITSSKYSGIGIENLGFAIPVDTVRFALSQFEKYGCIIRPDFGITLEQSWEAKIGLPTSKGLTVKESPNDILCAGDVIYQVNGIRVSSLTDWNEAIKSTYNGASVSLSIKKGGESGQTVQMTLDEIK
ncbi:MAG: trypsin-like serine protease [Ruminococcaceae bacterium]|nr:trypsin-like serine protease [Oscillospiraceae bacterium]